MKRKVILFIALILIVITAGIRLNEARRDQQKINEQLKVEQSETELKFKKQLEQIKDQNKQLDKQKQKLENENKNLKKDLQAKRERQAADARLAAAKATRKAQTGRATGSGNCEQYRPLFARYGWDIRTAMAIMQAESSCNPSIVSPSNDHGLMQINKGLQLYGTAIYNPAKNIQIAYTEKYLKGGWRHWTVYKSGAYTRYLK